MVRGATEAQKFVWKGAIPLQIHLHDSEVTSLPPSPPILAMSYAKLAGLSSIYGLYAGVMPVFMYAIFGSSRQLAVGPVALVSLLVSNTLSDIVDSSDTLYTELAILPALMVGMLECIMGLLRLGWLIRFISHSVISGFTTASAIAIAFSQAKYFLGYDITKTTKIVTLIKSIISGISGDCGFTWQPSVLGSCILAVLLIMKHLGKTKKYLRFLRAPGPLTGVVLGTAYVKIFNPSSISVQTEPEKPDPPSSIKPTEPSVYSFCKVLTASDTSTHGGFSVLRKHANECLPPLDMSQ